MRIIAIANQKRRVREDHDQYQFLCVFEFSSEKVLLIDLDPQGHSTCGLGIKTQKGMLTLYDLLSPFQRVAPPVSQVIRNLQNDFDLLPCNASLNALEEEFGFMPNYHLKLRDLMTQISEEQRHYDFVILDCPPNLGVLTWNALNAADEILIPIEPSFSRFHGLAKMSETLQIVNRSRETPLDVHALLTLYNSQVNFSQEIYDEVRAHFRNRLFTTIVHEHISLKEAAAAGKSIVQYAPQSQAFQDYLNLAVEYLERDWNRRLPKRELGWEQVFKNHFGPRQISDGMLFQFSSKIASSVEIAGDFNHWVPEPLVRRNQEGLWQRVISVELKTFRYKFIVDGEWQVDPNQPMQKENAYGGVDSYMEFA